MATILVHKNRVLTNTSTITDVTPDTYIRPVQWLSIPDIVSGTSVVYLLMGLTEKSDNWLAVNCAGNYTVDWGDGSIINYSANTIASYQAYWSGASSSTLTSDLYRQTLIKITPQSGQTLTKVDLSALHVSAKTSSYQRNYFDIKLSAPDLTSFTFVASPLLQQFEWIGTNKMTTFQSFFNVGLSSLKKIVSIDVSNANTTLGVYQLFGNCSSLVEIPSLTIPSGATNITSMFQACSKIKTIPMMDTSKVTNMSSMFSSTSALVTIPQLDTSKVIDMSSMFSSSGIVTVPLLDTSKVTTMASMFGGTTRLQTIPSFNTPLLTNISNMFTTSKIVSVPFFDVSKVTASAQYPFYQCSKLTYVAPLVTSGVTNFTYWFSQCTSLVETPLIDTSNGTDMTNMFASSSSLITIPLLNTSKVTNMSNMFNSCSSLITIPLIDTSKVNNTSSMFNGCTSLTSVPSLNLSAVTTTVSMFNGCSSLVTVPYLNTDKCTLFNNMFSNCIKLTGITGLNTISATTLSQLFYQDVMLVTSPTFNSPAVTIADYMFGNCNRLRSVGLFNASKITNVTSMFQGCNKLEEVPELNLSAATITGLISTTTALGSFLATGYRYAISFNSNNLSYSSIVTIFNNLGTAVGAQNINVALNPGSTSLTASDRLIATNKGWTVTY